MLDDVQVLKTKEYKRWCLVNAKVANKEGLKNGACFRLAVTDRVRDVRV